MREGGEIGVVGRRRGVVEDQAIVLVRDAGLFLPALAPAGKPEVGDRGRAQFRLGQRQEAAGGGVGDIGDEAGDGLVRVLRAHQLHEQFGDTPDDAGERGAVGGGGDLADEGGGGCGLEPCQVGLGQDADELAALDHGHVGDAAFDHGVKHVGHEGRGRQGEGVGRHDLRHRGFGRPPLGHGAGGDVARGQDAARGAVHGRDDARHAKAAHLLRRLDQRGVGGAGEGVFRHQFGQRHGGDVLPPGGGGPCAVEEAQHARVGGHERLEDGGGDGQKRAVFGRGGGDGSDPVAHQPAFAE